MIGMENEVNNKIVVDRTYSSLSTEVGKDVKEGSYIFTVGDTLDVRVFVDRSAVEIFVDEVAALATRIYPALPSGNSYDITSEGGSVRLPDMHAWTLDTATTSTEVCEHGELRDGFRSEVIAGVEENEQRSLYAFPNPATQTVYVLSATLIESISLTDLNGKEVAPSITVGGFDITVPVANCHEGLYILQVKTNKAFSTNA